MTMKEKWRDKTRDEIASAINSLGIKTEMAERKRTEEKILDSWWTRSLGIIDIPEGPIKWINVIKKDGSDKSPPRWWIIFGIPDGRLTSNGQKIKIRTIRKKSFPLFGKIIDVTWKGNDHGTGIVNTLSNDTATDKLAERIGNLEIRTHAKEFHGWTLQVDRKLNWFEPSTTGEDWQDIRKIADYLLSLPVSL
jgi:hypothetical protein